MKVKKIDKDLVLFDDGTILYSNGDLREEIKQRFLQTHYDVREKGSGGNLKVDNLWTLDVSDEKRVELFDRFKITSQDVILEVGAYKGWGTVKLSKTAKKVIAIEGDRNNFFDLLKNLALNSIKNVESYNKFVGAECKKRTIFESSHKQSISLHSDTLRSVKNSYNTDVVTIDSLVNEASYVVLEINGAELEALMGAEKLLTRNKIRLTAQGSYPADFPICYDMKDFLELIGYEVYIGKAKRVYAFN